jgi:hypothetical protein
MKLTVERKIFTEISTIGDLLIDNEFFCYTLEDKDRQRQALGLITPWYSALKISSDTAIPYGTYEVIINYSNRFQRLLPLLLNVPDFEGVRIHSGNTDKDTEGCILLGKTKSEDFIGNSREVFNTFFRLLKRGMETGKVFIEIT